MRCAGGAGEKGGELKNNKRLENPPQPNTKYRKGDSNWSADHTYTLN